MRIIASRGQDVTAEVLQERLAHTVEQHLKEKEQTKQVISDQQKQLNQQQQELETQSRANTGLAKLGLLLAAANSIQKDLLGQQQEQNTDLTLANQEAKSNGIRNTILSGLATFLVTNAAAPVAFIPQIDFIPNPPSAEVQGTAKKETLTDLQENVSGMLQEQYPSYKALPGAHRQYVEQHVLVQSGAVNDVKGFPHSLESVQDTAYKQGKLDQVTFSIPNPKDMHKILSLAFGNQENLNGTVPQYTMTEEQLTQTLNGN